MLLVVRVLRAFGCGAVGATSYGRGSAHMRHLERSFQLLAPHAAHSNFMRSLSGCRVSVCWLLLYSTSFPFVCTMRVSSLLMYKARRISFAAALDSGNIFPALPRCCHAIGCERCVGRASA